MIKESYYYYSLITARALWLPQQVRAEHGRQTNFCVIHSPKCANDAISVMAGLLKRRFDALNGFTSFQIC